MLEEERRFASKVVEKPFGGLSLAKAWCTSVSNLSMLALSHVHLCPLIAIRYLLR